MKVLVLGAGQLARMMALEATPLNIELVAYDVDSDQLMHPITKAPICGDLASAIAEVDVITAEFEHIPLDVLAVCERSGKLKPSAEAIATGGDRRVEKAMLDAAGVSSAKYHIVETKEAMLEAVEKLGLPLVLKSALSGYDGKGQWRLKSADQTDQVWSEISAFLAESSDKQAMVAEQFINFDREVSLVGVKDINGNTRVYPLAENIHVDGVLSLSLVTAQAEQIQAQAKQMFDAIAKQLDYVGVLAIEFFQQGDQLLVNEIAPRVHNSGHWSQQGALCSQFENHIRAVAGLAIGDTQLQSPTCMINILGEDTLPSALYEISGLAMHWYGKSKRAGRKMGHINVVAETTDQLMAKLGQIKQILDVEQFPALKDI